MFNKLAALGGEVLVKALEMLGRGELTAQPQDQSLSTYAPMLNKSISRIDWTKSGTAVHDLVRGLYSWPVADTLLHGKKLKILRTSPCERSGEAGTILSVDPLTVACGAGSVIIHDLQLESKNRMDSKTFLVGHQLNPGERLGE